MFPVVRSQQMGRSLGQPDWDKRSPSSYAPLALLLGGLLIAGYLVLTLASYREVIVLLVGVTGLGTVLAGARGIRWGFVGWIGTFGIGYRTIPISPESRIHPAELMLWGLLVQWLIWSTLEKHKRSSLWLPGWLWCFMPFWALAWWTGLRAGYSADHMLAELRDFVLFIPLFLVAGSVLRNRRNWRVVALAFYAVAAGIAGIGVLEYAFPGIRAVFPGWIGHPTILLSGEGFERAFFSFWGAPDATFTCALAVPMAIGVWRWWPGTVSRILTVGAAVLQGVAIYIAGYRSMWLLLSIELLLFLSMSKRYVLAGIVLLVAIAGHETLPTATQERVHSLAMILEGRPVDSSGQKRLHRVTDAIDATIEHPLGNGWAAAGWVHNDFLQVAANLGVVPGLLFLGAYGRALFRLWRRLSLTARHDKDRNLAFALLLSFVAAGGVLATQGVEVLPQLALPIWFVWVIAEVFLRQTSTQRRALTVAACNLRPFADIQLRSHHPRYPGIRQVGG